MMAAILNSAMLDSDTAILDSDTLLSSLRFTQKHYPSTLTLTQTNSIQLTRWWQPSWILPTWIQSFCTKLSLKLIHSHSTWLWQLILNSAILDSVILHKKNFTCSFWLNLMMAAIFNSAMLDSDTAILDSDTLLSSLRFTQKHSHSILNMTQTNSIWLKLIHSDSTWWWQSSWILPSWICPSWIQPSSLHIFTKKLSILTHFAQKKLHSFILTLDNGKPLEFVHLDDGSHLRILPCWISNCHLGSDTLLSSLNICSKRLFTPFMTLTQHLNSSWILPSWIQKNLQTSIWLQTHSFTQLNDGSHLTHSWT